MIRLNFQEGKKMRYIIYFGILMITISGCEKEIKMDIPDNERKLVLNGIFNLDNPFVLSVTKSKSLLESNKIETVDNAEIKFYEDDVYLTNAEINKWSYYNHYSDQNTGIRDSNYINFYGLKNIQLSTDKKYKLEVSAPGIDNKAYVEFKVPSLVPIVKFDTLTTYTDGWDRSLEFDITIQDPPNEENFYVLNIETDVIATFVNELGEIKLWDGMGSVLLETDNFSLTNEDDGPKSSLLFSDKLFDGKIKNIKLKSRNFSPYLYYRFEGFTLIGGTTKYYVFLKSISKDYYNYILSNDLYNSISENPLAEPISVRSNVKNGFGIVTAVNQWVDSSIVFTNPGALKKPNK